MIWVMLGLMGEQLGLDSWARATAERRVVGPARVVGAIDREAGAAKAAVCRSREERTIDAILWCVLGAAVSGRTVMNIWMEMLSSSMMIVFEAVLH